MSFGFFEHISAFDEQGRIETRRAVAVAARRVEEEFGNFLRSASAQDEYAHRLALVEENLKQTIADVAQEYGGDVTKLEAAVLGPLEHAAKGGFCDECRKWKSGPNAGCTCGESDDEPDVDEDPDSRLKQSDEDDYNEEERQEQERSARIATEPITYAAPLDKGEPEGVADLNAELEEAPSAVGYQTISMQRARQLMARTAEKGNGNTDLGGPSPKIDKKKWKPNALNDKGNLKPIDTDGGPYKTVKQDPTDKADWASDDFTRDTGKVEKEELPSNKDDAGYSTKKNVEVHHTDTWSGMDGQTDPVTTPSMKDGFKESGHLDPTGSPFGPTSPWAETHRDLGRQMVGYNCPTCGQDSSPDAQGQLTCPNCGPFDPNQMGQPNHMATAQDVEKNPIEEILQSPIDGFIPSGTVQSVIAKYEGK